MTEFFTNLIELVEKLPICVLFSVKATLPKGPLIRINWKVEPWKSHFWDESFQIAYFSVIRFGD